MDKTSVLNLSKELQERTRKSREEVEQLTSNELEKLAKNLSEQSRHALNTMAEGIKTDFQNQKTHLKSTMGEMENDLTKAMESHGQELQTKAQEAYKVTLKALTDLNQKAATVAETTAKETGTASQKLRRSLAVWPILTLLICLALCAALWGATLLLGKMIQSQTAELLEVNQNLRQARSQLQTYGIEATENEQGRFLILPPRMKAETGWKFGEQEGVKLSRK